MAGAVSHEILRDVLNSLASLAEEGIREVQPAARVVVAELAQAQGWRREGQTVYVVPHAFVANEQGLRGTSPRERVEGQGEEGETWRYLVPPLPLTLHFLFVPCAEELGDALVLLGRLFQLVQERPVLSSEELQGPSFGLEDRLPLSLDTQLSAERLDSLFAGSGAPTRLCVPCLVRFSLRSERVVREARPSRAINRAVRKV